MLSGCVHKNAWLTCLDLRCLSAKCDCICMSMVTNSMCTSRNTEQWQITFNFGCKYQTFMLISVCSYTNETVMYSLYYIHVIGLTPSRFNKLQMCRWVLMWVFVLPHPIWPSNIFTIFFCPILVILFPVFNWHECHPVWSSTAGAPFLLESTWFAFREVF